MGYRVKIREKKRTVYSKSYSTKEKAKKASKRIRGAKGIVKS